MATLLKETLFNNTNFKLVLEYEATLNNNEYNVTYYLYFQSMNGYSGGGAATNGYINNEFVGSTVGLGKNQKLLLGTTDEIVRPSSNGTFSTIYSASISCPWSNLGTASVSGTLNLPRVDLSSTWNYDTYINNMNLDTGSLTLKIKQYNNTYTNKVEVSNLQMTKIIKTINNAKNGDVIKFTDAELNQIYSMDQNPQKQRIRFYMNMYTYDSSGKQIGDVQRNMQDVDLKDANPKFTYTIIETDEKVIDVLEDDSASSLIKFASKPKVTINATGQKGATIKTISITNGTQANANENPHTFENIQTGVFNVTVTDSREFPTVEVINKTLLDYVPVNINSYEFKRADSTSSHILLTADITCYSGSFNSKANIPTIMYKVGSSGSYQEIKNGFKFADNKITFENYDLGELIPYTQENTIYLYVLDLLTEDAENYVITKGIPSFDSGEHDFQVNGQLFVANQNRENKVDVMEKINSLAFETGSNSNGNWIKYANGTLICYGTKVYKGETFDTAYWSDYVRAKTENMAADFPQEFIEPPEYCSVEVICYNTWAMKSQLATKTKSHGVTVLSPKADTSTRDVYLEYYAIGRWKK